MEWKIGDSIPISHTIAPDNTRPLPRGSFPAAPTQTYRSPTEDRTNGKSLDVEGVLDEIGPDRRPGIGPGPVGIGVTPSDGHHSYPPLNSQADELPPCANVSGGNQLFQCAWEQLGRPSHRKTAFLHSPNEDIETVLAEERLAIKNHCGNSPVPRRSQSIIMIGKAPVVMTGVARDQRL